MYFDTPRDFIGGVYEELLYGDQPLGLGHHRDARRPSCGDPETFHEYLGRWYQPAHGRRPRRPDRRRPAARSRSCSATSSLARPTSRGRRARGAARTAGPRGVSVHHKAVRPGAPGARRAQAASHPDRYTLQLLSTVLGGGMSSRLLTEVRERRGLAYYVYGSNHMLGHGTPARCGRRRASTSSGSTSAVETILGELRRGWQRRRCLRTSWRRHGRSRRGGSCSGWKPARQIHVRPAARGARGRADRARRRARRPRRRHRRGHPARGAGADRRRRPPPRGDRPVRGRGALPEAARVDRCEQRVVAPRRHDVWHPGDQVKPSRRVTAAPSRCASASEGSGR